MKNLLFILLCFFSISANGQLVSFILRGDTLFAKNPSTGEERQITKFVPAQAGQSGKVLSTNGTAYQWIDAVTGIPSDTSAAINNRILVNLQRLLDSLVSHITKIDGKQPVGTYATGSGSANGVNTGDNAINTTYSNDYRAANFIAGTNYLSPTGNGSGLTGLTKTQVGLSNVDNTSDADKPVSTATQTALNGKQATITTGTTAQYLRGDLSLSTYTGYAINVQALTSSPTDAQTIYFGTLPKAPVTAAATSKVYVRQAGTITAAEIYCFSGTAGTNEAWSLYIRVNNTTDYLIQTISVNTSERIFTNSSLSIPLVAGDYFEIKGVQPTWVTNPLTTIYGGYVRIN